MVKRLLALGAAVALALSLSVSSFAAIYHSTVNLEFPFYGHLRVRQGGTQLFLGSDGVPVSGNTASSLSGTGGSIVYDFYPHASHYTSNTDDAYFVFKTMTSVMDVDLTQYGEMDVHYRSDGTINYIESPITDIDSRIYTEIDSVDIGSDCTVTCKNIVGGSYLLEGFLEFPIGSINDQETWLNMISGVSGQVITSSGSYALTIPYTSYDIKTTNNKDRVNFKLALGVPYTGEYQRLFFQFNSKSNSPIPALSAFSINTGSLQIQQIESVSGLGYALAGWFNDTINAIKNGFYTQSLDAGAAAQNKDQDSVDTAQSQVAAVESFEASTSQSISSGVSTINNSGYLTVPDYTSSASGMGAALAAIGWIFAGVFNRLNGYQVVVTVPLVLGIMLILVGRGTLALGRVISANARAARREGRGSS